MGGSPGFSVEGKTDYKLRNPRVLYGGGGGNKTHVVTSIRFVPRPASRIANYSRSAIFFDDYSEQTLRRVSLFRAIPIVEIKVN